MMKHEPTILLAKYERRVREGEKARYVVKELASANLCSKRTIWRAIAFARTAIEAVKTPSEK